jgi:hypothetical protein
VLNEIEETLEREAQEGGRSILVPVTLDDYVFKRRTKHADIAERLRRRVVADFRETATPYRFARAMNKLVEALTTPGRGKL